MLFGTTCIVIYLGSHLQPRNSLLTVAKWAAGTFDSGLDNYVYIDGKYNVLKEKSISADLIQEQ